MQLDRQTVTVVTGNIRRVEAKHRARLHDQVFQDLVQRGAKMNVRVRVWWAIVQDEFWGAGAGRLNLLVQLHIGPFFQARGFGLWQIRFLRELRFRQIDRLF